MITFIYLGNSMHITSQVRTFNLVKKPMIVQHHFFGLSYIAQRVNSDFNCSITLDFTGHPMERGTYDKEFSFTLIQTDIN